MYAALLVCSQPYMSSLRRSPDHVIALHRHIARFSCDITLEARASNNADVHAEGILALYSADVTDCLK